MALRIGLIGTGWVAGQHIKSLGQIPEARIVACADVDADRAAEAASRIAGCAAYADYREMLDAGALDAVYVCVPPHVHGEIEMAAIERGLPFFLEKPLGNELETPRRILEAVQKKGITTAVGYMMRYQPNVARVREFLAGHEPIAARGAYLAGIPGAPWWRRKEQSGGQIIEQSTHIYDLTRYLFGEVESVCCRGRRGLVKGEPNYTVDDASLCSLTFRSGLLCEITSSCAFPMTEISLEVFCTGGRLKLNRWPFELSLQTPEETRSYPAAPDVFAEEDRVFVGALLSGDASAIRSTYADAFKTMALTCAAEESMATQGPVRVS
jgi:myo-inositol 2-dehydrogenase/D-chiro-inositol 1-dehydrogenase